MTKQFLVNVNLSRNELQNARIQNLASAPSSPVAGQVYFDTVLSQFGVYSGSVWVYLPASIVQSVTAGDSTITIGGTATNPTVKVAKTLDHTWITDFDTQVRTSRLDQMAAPTSAVSLNNQKITNLADPTAASDAASKGYVDNVAQGLSPKGSSQAATTTALPNGPAVYNNGTSGVGATLTAATNGALGAIDGYTVAVGDRILVKNEAAAANNGIYTATSLGSGGSKYVLTRALDNDSASEIAGAFTFVLNGTVNLNQGWVVDSIGPYTIGTTAITWTQFTGTADITVSFPLSKSGNNISAPNVPTKFIATIGDGVATSIAVTHNLGSLETVESIRDAATGLEPECDITHTDANNTTFGFTSAPASNAYKVVVIG